MGILMKLFMQIWESTLWCLSWHLKWKNNIKALHSEVDFSNWDHRGCHSKSSFNLAIKYLSINFHNNMYMNKTFHLPSYICMCFNPLVVIVVMCMNGAHTSQSKWKLRRWQQRLRADDMIKDSWAYCLLSSYMHTL